MKKILFTALFVGISVLSYMFLTKSDFTKSKNITKIDRFDDSNLSQTQANKILEFEHQMVVLEKDVKKAIDKRPMFLKDEEFDKQEYIKYRTEIRYKRVKEYANYLENMFNTLNPIQREEFITASLNSQTSENMNKSNILNMLNGIKLTTKQNSKILQLEQKMIEKRKTMQSAKVFQQIFRNESKFDKVSYLKLQQAEIDAFANYYGNYLENIFKTLSTDQKRILTALRQKNHDQ